MNNPPLTELLCDLIHFHIAGDVPVVEQPAKMPLDRLLLREKLVREESNELRTAILENDLVAILQESLDTIYVVVGTLVEAGLIQVSNPAWKALQASNMAKADPFTGKLTKRGDGKILKPEGWQAVDFAKIIFPDGKPEWAHKDKPATPLE